MAVKKIMQLQIWKQKRFQMLTLSYVNMQQSPLDLHHISILIWNQSIMKLLRT